MPLVPKLAQKEWSFHCFSLGTGEPGVGVWLLSGEPPVQCWGFLFPLQRFVVGPDLADSRDENCLN